MVKIESGSAIHTPLWMLASAVILLGARVGLSVTESIRPPAPTAEVSWQTPANAETAVKANAQKLVLYDFRADWCDPCRQMEKTAFWSKDVVAQLNKNFVAVRITDKKRENGKNSQKVQNLEDEFSVQAFPTLVVAMPDGTKIIDRLGAGNSSAVKKFLEEALTLADYFKGKEEIIDGDAKAAACSFDDFIAKTKWQHWRCCYAAVFACIAHRQLGNQGVSDKIVNDALHKVNDHAFPYPILNYLAGRRSFDELLKDASENKTNRILCYAYSGMDLFARKEYDKAKERFEWVLANCDDKDTFEYRIARAELRQVGGTSTKTSM